MQNYNTYTNDNIARQGLMNSYQQSQQIKPNELINDNPVINRDGFDKENKFNYPNALCGIIFII